jgi:phospholipase C
MPTQESGTRPHRPASHQPHADVTVNRATGQVTASLTNTGTVGVSLAVYPDAYLPFTPPRHGAASAPRSYVWDATLTGGKYAFSVYGPDGFLTSFAGEVVPPARTPARSRSSPPPSQSGPAATVELTLANEGQEAITYTLTPNDYEGRTQTSPSSSAAPRPSAGRPTSTATTTW